MEIIEDITKAETDFPNVVLTVGSFDGIHMGHRYIIEDVVRKAKALDGTPAMLTMRPHPREYFSPNNAPNLLCDFDKKIELLGRQLHDLATERGIRDDLVLIGGGTQVTDAMARACGLDAGFGRGATGQDVASFVVRALRAARRDGERE